jgi:hypothetical protein
MALTGAKQSINHRLLLLEELWRFLNARSPKYLLTDSGLSNPLNCKTCFSQEASKAFTPRGLRPQNGKELDSNSLPIQATLVLPQQQASLATPTLPGAFSLWRSSGSALDHWAWRHWGPPSGNQNFGSGPANPRAHFLLPSNWTMNTPCTSIFWWLSRVPRWACIQYTFISFGY